MKEKPILMTGEMVRAVLDGRKTMTRRIIDFRKIAKQTGCTKGKLAWSTTFNSWAVFGGNGVADLHLVDAPYQVGMKLWVRETWGKGTPCNCSTCATVPIRYKADWNGEPVDKWKPSIHMPKRFSRLTLEITNVRVERLQDISEEDAKAEGVELLKPGFYRAYDCKEGFATTAKRSFETLWTSIYGPDSWSANPLIWVLEFRQFPLSKTGEG